MNFGGIRNYWRLFSIHLPYSFGSIGNYWRLFTIGEYCCSFYFPLYYCNFIIYFCRLYKTHLVLGHLISALCFPQFPNFPLQPSFVSQIFIYIPNLNLPLWYYKIYKWILEFQVLLIFCNFRLTFLQRKKIIILDYKKNHNYFFLFNFSKPCLLCSNWTIKLKDTTKSSFNCQNAFE